MKLSSIFNAKMALVLGLCLVPALGFCDPNLTTFQAEINDGTDIVKDIIKTLAIVCVMGGFIGVIWKVISGEPQSKAAIGGLIGGILLYTIMVAMF